MINGQLIGATNGCPNLLQKATMNIVPIRQVGAGQSGTLCVSYQAIEQLVGAPNVTDLDDAFKVKASWGFMDAATGRRAFIWCYKVADPISCREWSIDGDKSLIDDLFGAVSSEER